MLILEQSLQTIYGFTLRRTSKKDTITNELYLEHLKKLSCYGVLCKFTDVIFEETGGLHCHGIVKIYKTTSLNRFRTRGWRMHLVEIYDMLQWQQYLNKNQEDLLPDMIDPPDDDFIWPTKKMFS